MSSNSRAPFPNSTSLDQNAQDGRNFSFGFPPPGTRLKSPRPSVSTTFSSTNGSKPSGFASIEAERVAPAPPAKTLLPSIQRHVDTSLTENLTPVPPGNGSHLFYGDSDPSKPGQFAHLNLYFTSFAVDLDNFKHVAATSAGLTNLSVAFGTEEAFAHASDTWLASEGLVLVTYSPVCANHDRGERCYFKVSTLLVDQSEGTRTIIAQGQFKGPQELTSRGETRWGRWSSPGGSDGSVIESVPHSGNDQPFLSDSDREAANERTSQRRTLTRRWFWDAIKGAAKAWGKLNVGISKGVLTWAIPDPASNLSVPSQVPEDHQRPPPWDNAILLKTFGNADENGFMDIFCVDCGTFGNTTFAGRASWSVVDGITEDKVEIETDMRLSLKVGVEAQMKLDTNFFAELFRLGLPGLSYGIVTIGPQLSVGVRAEMQAAADGRLLVGAEMGLRDARIELDLVDSASPGSGSSGLEPFFEPTFEAEGELTLAALFALPISLELGVQIEPWHKSVAVVDEPSIRATAQAAGAVNQTYSRGFGGTDGCRGLSTQLSLRNTLSISVLDVAVYSLHDTGDQPQSRECVVTPSRDKDLSPNEDSSRGEESSPNEDSSPGNEPPPNEDSSPGKQSSPNEDPSQDKGPSPNEDSSGREQENPEPAADPAEAEDPLWSLLATCEDLLKGLLSKMKSSTPAASNSRAIGAFFAGSPVA